MSSFTITKQMYADGKISKPEYISQMAGLHAIVWQYTDLLKNSKCSEIIISENEIIAVLDSGIKLSIIPGDSRVVPIEILNFGYYEDKLWEQIFDFISKPKVIFDIGANIGYFSLFMRQRLKNVSIHAFEPIPNTFYYLKKNISINSFHKSELTNSKPKPGVPDTSSLRNNAKSKGIQSGMNIYNFGFTNMPQHVEMFYYPTSCGGSSLCNIIEENQVEKIMCEFTTLDTFVQENNIETIDLIKCDVEGAEKFVFEGGMKTLEKFKPVIYCEMLRKWALKFNYHPNDIINQLDPLGYKCYSINDEHCSQISYVTDGTTESNFIFAC